MHPSKCIKLVYFKDLSTLKYKKEVLMSKNKLMIPNIK